MSDEHPQRDIKYIKGKELNKQIKNCFGKKAT